MAKKKTAKGAAAKKTSRSAPGRKKAATKAVRKTGVQKTAPSRKKTVRKAVAKKVTKKVAKKVTKKVTKKVAKKVAKAAAAPASRAKTAKVTKKTSARKPARAKGGASGQSKPVRLPFGVFDRNAMKESQKAAARLAAAAGVAAPDASSQTESISTAPQKRLKKSPLSKKQQSDFRDILLRKRSEIVGDVDAMESEALSGGGSGSLSRLPQHMADQGSDTYDQSLALDLAASQRGLLKEIDEALEKIDEGTYGICEVTGGPIDMERLQAKPWARLSIEAARMQER